jgi:N-6 DNA Methylase
MNPRRDWLYERLRSESIRQDQCARWNSIISRLSSLTSVDDSSMHAGLLERKAAQEELANQIGEEHVDRGRTKATLGAASVPLDVPVEVRSQREIMDTGQRHLVSLAAALMGNPAGLSPSEKNLLAHAQRVDSRLIAHARTQILAGKDVLGAVFCSLRSAEQRRQRGATYTPAPIVDAMVAWAQAEISSPARVVDPGAGSGRFLIAAARKFSNAQLIAVELDPLATLMLRANAAVHGFADRLAVHLVDYRSFALPAIACPTLFIGNPPYVRHHNISQQGKTWFAVTANRLGLTASKLAGLHIHFFLKTRELATRRLWYLHHRGRMARCELWRCAPPFAHRRTGRYGRTSHRSQGPALRRCANYRRGYLLPRWQTAD